MNPIRVTAPASPVVSLTDLKQYLRVNGDATDGQIEQLEKAAVAHLDGWRGILGRCIQAQTWQLTLAVGTHGLPFPDINSVEGGDWDGQRVTVIVSGPVRFTCALPEDAMPAIADAVKLWVQMRYDGLSGPERAAHQDAFDRLVAPLRWTRI